MSDLVLLYGSVRAGTTMSRLILGAHEALNDIGENRYLLEHLKRAPGGGWTYDRAGLTADRVLRKRGLSAPEDVDGRDLMASLVAQLAARRPGRPVLTLHSDVSRFHALVPTAPIIHLVRDPRDVGRSCVGMGWNGNAYYGVDAWLVCERDWERFDASGARVLEVRYEALLSDIEGQLRRICAFLGVPYSEAMLTYSETSTYDRPDSGLVEQWRRKMSPRQAALVEGKVGSLLTARGYEHGPAGPAQPSSLEKITLKLDDVRGRWRRGIGLYGAPLFLGEKISRGLGLRRLHRRISFRMHTLLEVTLK